jgi:hypothetical protein
MIEKKTIILSHSIETKNNSSSHYDMFAIRCGQPLLIYVALKATGKKKV